DARSWRAARPAAECSPVTQDPSEDQSAASPRDGVRSGIAAVDRYLAQGFASVPGMSSRFAAAICGGLLRIQGELAVRGPLVEIRVVEGRFFIALPHPLAPGGNPLAHHPLDLPDAPSLGRFPAQFAPPRRAPR